MGAVKFTKERYQQGSLRKVPRACGFPKMNEESVSNTKPRLLTIREHLAAKGRR